MGKVISYSGWAKGINNRQADYDVEMKMLRDGVNIDIMTSGKVRRRRGMEQALADPGAHSIYSGDPSRMVWATANALKITDSDVGAITTLLTDSRLASPLSFVSLHGEIYFSNEQINGKINTADVYEPWGVIPPANAPTLMAPTLTASDSARKVMVTCTFVMDTGEESGAPLATSIVCNDTPMITVTDIPQSSDSRVVATRLYVSELDGSLMFANIDIVKGQTSYYLTGHFDKGEALKTQFMQPPPPGQLLEYQNGKIYIASDKNIFCTQPLRYGCYDPQEDYLMFPARVTLLKSSLDVMFISADQMRALTGLGTEQVGNRKLLPYKAIEGSGVNIPNSNDVMWLTERGFVRGSADGNAVNLTESQVAMTDYSRACMGFVEYKGHKAVIAITTGGSPSEQVHDDYVAAEAKRLTDEK